MEHIERKIETEVLESKNILEIGSGILPRIRQNGEKYIAIDWDYDDLLCGKSDFKRGKEKLISDSLFVCVQAENIPIKDGSIDEIFVSNVFGYPSRTRENSFFRILEEICRVLKNDGLVKIVESYSPYDENRLKQLFSRQGFSFVKSSYTEHDFE